MNTTNDSQRTNPDNANFKISFPRLVLLASILALSSQPIFAQKSELLKRSVIDQVDSIEPVIEEMAIKLWDYSELALLETRSADLLVNVLDKAGFKIQTNVADMPTAFVATYGAGPPVIGILAEYDALPGVGNQVVPKRKPRADGVTSGQGCGHNLFGAASVGAAIALKKLMEAEDLKGTIKLFGTPAEETVVGKVYMAKAEPGSLTGSTQSWNGIPAGPMRCAIRPDGR